MIREINKLKEYNLQSLIVLYFQVKIFIERQRMSGNFADFVRKTAKNQTVFFIHLVMKSLHMVLVGKWFIRNQSSSAQKVKKIQK